MITENHEVNRITKTVISLVLTAIVVFSQNDPNPIVSLIAYPILDRARAYIFRRLNID